MSDKAANSNLLHLEIPSTLDTASWQISIILFKAQQALANSESEFRTYYPDTNKQVRGIEIDKYTYTEDRYGENQEIFDINISDPSERTVWVARGIRHFSENISDHERESILKFIDEARVQGNSPSGFAGESTAPSDQPYTYNVHEEGDLSNFTAIVQVTTWNGALLCEERIFGKTINPDVKLTPEIWGNQTTLAYNLVRNTYERAYEDLQSLPASATLLDIISILENISKRKVDSALRSQFHPLIADYLISNINFVWLDAARLVLQSLTSSLERTIPNCSMLLLDYTRARTAFERLDPEFPQSSQLEKKVRNEYGKKKEEFDNKLRELTQVSVVQIIADLKVAVTNRTIVLDEQAADKLKTEVDKLTSAIYSRVGNES